MDINLETKTCTKCSQNFTIDDNDRSFYQKMKVPVPTVCPDCRFKMRAMWRNETSLYNRKCAKTDKSIISMYNPKSPYTVVSHEYYESDKWDPKEYAQDYDLNASFFDQFYNVLLQVPKAATFISTGDGINVNSEYSNYAGGLKNCYLVFNSGPAEEIMYSRGLRGVREVSDCYFGVETELMYESINCQKSSRIYFGKNVTSCVDCIFITNASGCMNCFCCVNIRNGSYQVFNKQVSKEEYEQIVSETMGSYEKISEMKERFAEFEKEFPMRENHNLKTVDSTGDYLFECKDVQNSFEVVKGEDSKFIFASKEIKDSYGTIGYGFKSERLLECTSTGYSSNVIGGATLTNCRDVSYSYFLRNCHDCIGCDSLRNASYCILNKQYSKEEYEKIRDQIVAELTEQGVHGLIMPPELAPFAYNETIAQDNMPLTREEAIAQGFRWEDDIQMTKGKETIQPEQIPDHIRDVSEDTTKEVLRCVTCERNYRITPQELLFYRKMTLPIPRECFYCRHTDRIRRRGPYQFWDRECAHCNKAIKTTYAPERPEIVFCESCYQQEVM